MSQCCTPLVTGSGNAPGELVVNLVPGDPVNLDYRRCDGWPDDLTATLRLSHPYPWELLVIGSVNGEWLHFHIDVADAREIPRDAKASIVLEFPGVEPYTWLAGYVVRREGSR